MRGVECVSVLAGVPQPERFLFFCFLLLGKFRHRIEPFPPHHPPRDYNQSAVECLGLAL